MSQVKAASVRDADEENALVKEGPASNKQRPSVKREAEAETWASEAVVLGCGKGRCRVWWRRHVGRRRRKELSQRHSQPRMPSDRQYTCCCILQRLAQELLVLVRVQGNVEKMHLIHIPWVAPEVGEALVPLRRQRKTDTSQQPEK